MHGHWLRGILGEGKPGSSGGRNAGHLVVTIGSGEHLTADKTFGEIKDALERGQGVLFVYPDSGVISCSEMVTFSKMDDIDDSCQVIVGFVSPFGVDRLMSANGDGEATLDNYPYFPGGTQS